MLRSWVNGWVGVCIFSGRHTQCTIPSSHLTGAWWITPTCSSLWRQSALYPMGYKTWWAEYKCECAQSYLSWRCFDRGATLEYCFTTLMIIDILKKPMGLHTFTDLERWCHLGIIAVCSRHLRPVIVCPSKLLEPRHNTIPFLHDDKRSYGPYWQRLDPTQKYALLKSVVLQNGWPRNSTPPEFGKEGSWIRRSALSVPTKKPKSKTPGLFWDRPWTR